MAAPKHANIGIVIGDKDITVSHNNFSRLEIERVVSDAANKFTLNVLDDTAFDVESALIQGTNDISIYYYDSENKINVDFNGNITKMSSSFINNRNMLTLEGYVGITIKDKYQLWSRSWNKVVVFPWEQIFDDWPDDTDPNDANKPSDTRSGWKKVGDFLLGLFVDQTYDLEGYTAKAESLITEGKIYQDENGTFYTFSQRKKDEGKAVVGTEIILPVRPHKILKLIAEGGKMSDLMERLDNLETYTGCAQFIEQLEGRRNILVDLGFIRKFLDTFDPIPGNGWHYDDKNIAETQLVHSDLSQVTTSDIKYIYETLVNNSIEINSTTNELKYGFKFSLDDNYNVTFKPVDVDANQEPKITYTYYGSFNSDENSVLTSFSADTNILTAYLTGDKSVLSELSNLNLVTNEEMTSDILAEQEKQTYSRESEYQFSFKAKAFSPMKVTTSSQNATATWKQYWFSAMSQVYKAKATVIGNSGLAPGDYVEILVIPRPGLYHHSSGLYYIIKQTDRIENGKMTSDLELIKNVASMGSADINVGGGGSSSGGGSSRSFGSTTHKGSSGNTHGGGGGSW